jgi:hypothetical protein
VELTKVITSPLYMNTYSRSNSTTFVGTTVVPIPHGGLGAGTNLTIQNRSFDNYYEWITTETGFGRWHPVEHYKRSTWLSQANVVYSIGPFGSSGRYYTYKHTNPWWEWENRSGTGAGFGQLADNPFTGLPALVPFNLLTSRSISAPSDIDSICSRGLANMMPGMKPKLSLINDLIELKDFKSLPKTIKAAQHLLRDVVRLKSTIRDILRVSSDIYLQKSFNVDPTVSDVFSIVKGLRNVRAQVEHLYAQEKRYLSSHFANPVNGTYPDKNEAVTVGVSSTTYGGFTYYRRVTYSEARVIVSADYAYDLQGLPKELALIGGLLDDLGVNINLQILWNAIPWSFVVDWLVNIGSWLSQFQQRNVDPLVLIYRNCYSFKAVRTIETSMSLCSGGPDVSGTVPVARIVETAFKRSFFDPNIVASVEWSGLNLREFSLASALGLGRLKKRR